MKVVLDDFKDASGKWVKYVVSNKKMTYTRAGSIWLNLVQRCKPGSVQNRSPRYAGCENAFEDFDSFVDWCQLQTGYAKGFQMDKDLLVRGNKVYSPETVVFLPAELNCILTKANATRGDSPIGVTWSKFHEKYAAQCQNGTGRQKHLGYFQRPEDAFAAYKRFKESFMRESAEAWKDQIDERAYKALVEYEVRIND